MAVDAAMRKLKVPPKFMPYLEKHRIYELFHDLGDHLAMACPHDPIQFLKNCLEQQGQGRDKRLIIFIVPPHLDRIRLAQLVSVQTGCDLLSRYVVCRNLYDSHTLAVNTANIIKTSRKEGWILSDFPDTKEEAKLLIKSGVLPTHVFLLVTDEQESQEDGKENLTSIDTTLSIIQEYHNNVYHLRELFRSSLKIVKIKNRSFEDIANLCARIAMKMPIRHFPKLFRVVLIGPRGSRRRTLAKLLHKQFNVVHVDMNILLNAARIMESNLGDEIRFMDENGFLYPTKIVFDLLKTRLSKEDCLNCGYVLTNFPTSVEDFVLLDSIDTPPNRVIFLTIDGNECQERLEDRVVNMYTGSLYSKKEIDENHKLKSQALAHPDDEPCKVSEEIKFYDARVEAMIDYCGKSCFMVDARGSITDLLERVEGVLMGSSPPANPRSGKLLYPHSAMHHLDSTKKIRQSFPISRTEIIPLIDSEELLRRFDELKGSHTRCNELREKSDKTMIQEPHTSSTVSKISGDEISITGTFLSDDLCSECKNATQ